MERWLYIAVALLVAITVHEFSHAWVAYRLGDPTAKSLGRLSLNPLVHLDPLGTIMMIFTALAGFGIGWGKPVPVNPYNLRAGARVGMAQVSLAGPMANLITALVLALPFRLGLVGFRTPGPWAGLLLTIIIVNVALAVFNLIPISPLDGFKVLLGLLPARTAYALAPMEQYGPPLLLLLIFMESYSRVGIIGLILHPLTGFALRVLTGIRWF